MSLEKSLKYWKEKNFLNLYDIKDLDLSKIPQNVKKINCNHCNIINSKLHNNVEMLKFLNSTFPKNTLDVFPKNLEKLELSYNHELQKISNLPNKLKALVIQRCKKLSFNNFILPDSLTELGINYNDLKEYPKFLTKNITKLMLIGNNIEFVDYIPENLEMVNFEHNKISSINYFPKSIKELNISHNNISILPEIPENLTVLILSHNPLEQIPQLSNNLKELELSGLNLDSIEKIPSSLKILDISDNKLTNLLDLPLTLEHLNISKNLLEYVDVSKLDKLISYECGFCKMKQLSNLPDNITRILCNNNELTKLPKLPPKLINLNCSNNKLTKLEKINLPMRTLNCSHNKIKILEFDENIFNKIGFYTFNLSYNNLSEIPDIKNFDKISKLTLDISHNKIKTVDEKFVNNKKIEINLIGNPLSKKYYHLAEVNKKNIQKRNLDDKEFQVITIPKGTVIFRNNHRMEHIIFDYIGAQSVENPDEYILSPDHQLWFYLKPFDNWFGKVQTFNVVTRDIVVILGLLPSKLVGKDIIISNRNFIQVDCNTKKYKTKSTFHNGGYQCLNDELIESHPDIMGALQNNKVDDSTFINSSRVDLDYLDYWTYYEDFDKYINIPELVLYPRRIRDTMDRVTNIKDINTEWFSKHINEYNFKPLVTIDASINNEENWNSSDLYKSKVQNVITAFLSPQGYKDHVNGETYHMTVNKKDRTYVIAEFASEELLKDCLPIDYCDKVKYLEEH